MNSKINAPTRRHAITGIAVALCGAAAGSRTRASAQTPATAANQARTSLHQEIELSATPQRIFDVLLDSKLFAAFTGMAATIDPKPGGAFSIFGGMIEGRNIEIISGQRIVQAWRPAAWDPGVYSIVHFELKSSAGGTLVILDHTGFPEGDFDHLDPGWHLRYWDPLKKYLAGQ